MAEFKGTYYNGKTSAGIPVTVVLLPFEIKLTGHNGLGEPVERSWEVDKIGRNDFNNAELVELHYGVSPPEYLEVKNPGFLI